MDALDLLTDDHNHVRELFSRWRASEENDDRDGMSEAAGEIVRELEVHTTIEEEIFYPTVHDWSEELADIVDEGVEEHHVAKVLITEVSALEPGDDRWTAKMKVLIENVEHHADEEESEMFPMIRSASDSKTRNELGKRLQARKAELAAAA